MSAISPGARALLIVVFFVPCSSILSAQPSPLVGHVAAPHIGPDWLYPSSTLTPGVAATVDVQKLTDAHQCPPATRKVDCSYFQIAPQGHEAERNAVYKEFRVPTDKRNWRSGEVDHLDPLCNGGSNDIHNLWYEPAIKMWNGTNFGYHQKDDLEAWVCREVKAGRLDPSEVFQKITSDWVKYYLEVKPKHVKFSN